MSFYHDGNRAVQARFGSTALADRLEERLHRTRLTDEDKSFIESVSFFFLATADTDGRPDCSFKGGAPGFVRVVSPELIVFPDFDGNGMFRSLGNMSVNANVGMLFIAMDATPKRLRINGRAEVSFDDAEMESFAGAQALIRVTPEHIFPNCPRYIPDLEHGVASKYAPPADVAPIEPGWKERPDFKDVVPPRKA